MTFLQLKNGHFALWIKCGLNEIIFKKDFKTHFLNN